MNKDDWGAVDASNTRRVVGPIHESTVCRCVAAEAQRILQTVNAIRDLKKR
jgi:hypothetical protein